MQSRIWTFTVFAILIVAMGIVAGCQSDLERAAEATVEVQEEKIGDFFTVAEELVMTSAELAGGLPSQVFEAELIVADLEEINSRLDAAVEMEAEAKVTALEEIAELLQTVQGKIEDAVSEASEEAQDALEQLQSNLEDLQNAVQDEIANVKDELGEAADKVEQAAEEAAGEAEATVEAVEETMEEAEEGVEEAVDEAEATPTSSD